MQAFPPAGNDDNREFYISGHAVQVENVNLSACLISETKITVGNNEVLFELLLERAMYTKLEDPGTPNERVMHLKWHSR